LRSPPRHLPRRETASHARQHNMMVTTKKKHHLTCHTSVGACHTSVGACHTSVGACHTSVGDNRSITSRSGSGVPMAKRNEKRFMWLHMKRFWKSTEEETCGLSVFKCIQQYRSTGTTTKTPLSRCWVFIAIQGLPEAVGSDSGRDSCFAQIVQSVLYAARR
jgi:hypothetical protein